MALVRALTVYCEGGTARKLCQQKMVGAASLSNATVRRLLTKAGWSEDKGCDYCPRCTKRYTKTGYPT